jgi:hypothetical protein
MGVARPRLLLNALGSIAVLTVVAAIGIGLPVLDRAVAADRSLPAGVAYRVGGGVSLVPPAGATLDAGRTRPGESRGTAVFRVGTVRLAVQVSQFRGPLPTAVDRLRTKLVRGAGCRLTGSEQPVTTTTGLAGVQGDYSVHRRAGRFAVYVTDGLSIEATVEGPPEEFGVRLPAFQVSLASIRPGGRQ